MNKLFFILCLLSIGLSSCCESEGCSQHSNEVSTSTTPELKDDGSKYFNLRMRLVHKYESDMGPNNTPIRVWIIRGDVYGKTMEGRLINTDIHDMNGDPVLITDPIWATRNEGDMLFFKVLSMSRLRLYDPNDCYRVPGKKASGNEHWNAPTPKTVEKKTITYPGGKSLGQELRDIEAEILLKERELISLENKRNDIERRIE